MTHANKRAYEIQWPTPPGCNRAPRWTGHGFDVDGALKPVLAFPVAASGWSDELTEFYDETAGESHPIDTASRRHTFEQLEQNLPGGSPVILEVGISSGLMMAHLAQALPEASLIAADIVPEPLAQFARRDLGIPIMQFDLTSCPLPDASVDAVILLNVLEHIKDDTAALSEVKRILKPGGVAVFEVPADPELFDVHDAVLMHHRRYRMSEFLNQVRAQGLTVKYKSHLGALMYPAFWAVKRWNQRYLSSPPEVQKEVVARATRKTSKSQLMEAATWVETQLRRHVYLPFGIRCLVTGVKPAA